MIRIANKRLRTKWYPSGYPKKITTISVIEVILRSSASFYLDRYLVTEFSIATRREMFNVLVFVFRNNDANVSEFLIILSIFSILLSSCPPFFFSALSCSFVDSCLLSFRYHLTTRIRIACASPAKFTVGGRIIIRAPPRRLARLSCNRPQWKAITPHPWKWARTSRMVSKPPEILNRRRSTNKDTWKLTSLRRLRRLSHRPFASWWVSIDWFLLINCLPTL